MYNRNSNKALIVTLKPYL